MSVAAVIECREPGGEAAAAPAGGGTPRGQQPRRLHASGAEAGDCLQSTDPWTKGDTKTVCTVSTRLEVESSFPRLYCLARWVGGLPVNKARLGAVARTRPRHIHLSTYKLTYRRYQHYLIPANPWLPLAICSLDFPLMYCHFTSSWRPQYKCKSLNKQMKMFIHNSRCVCCISSNGRTN